MTIILLPRATFTPFKNFISKESARLGLQGIKLEGNAEKKTITIVAANGSILLAQKISYPSLDENFDCLLKCPKELFNKDKAKSPATTAIRPTAIASWMNNTQNGGEQSQKPITYYHNRPSVLTSI
ncbi:MAG: hypothetical protein AB7F19_07800 [Candidatus Babeliales bacterium]